MMKKLTKMVIPLLLCGTGNVKIILWIDCMGLIQPDELKKMNPIFEKKKS